VALAHGTALRLPESAVYSLQSLEISPGSRASSEELNPRKKLKTLSFVTMHSLR
jgi:hypothetical protein